MTVDIRAFTADELLRMPDDGWRYELVEGELRKMSPSGADHGSIAARIAARMLVHVEEQRLGGRVYVAETGFQLSRDPDTVLAPDAAYVVPERVVNTPKYFPGAPDIAVEVISPNDLYTEVAEKTACYLAAGTSAVVIVDPRRFTVQVHRKSGVTGVTDALTLAEIPGWSMTLDDIFTTVR
ncbi:MAG TPA: Uma2 family endonuclease [Thermoanaerobaculia bacterium]|nr:Uma2 family endonuclease [Thermoanaerobaculia bacterium]